MLSAGITSGKPALAYRRYIDTHGRKEWIMEWVLSEFSKLKEKRKVVFLLWDTV